MNKENNPEAKVISNLKSKLEEKQAYYNKKVYNYIIKCIANNVPFVPNGTEIGLRQSNQFQINISTEY